MHTTEAHFYQAIIVSLCVLGLFVGIFVFTMVRHQRRYIKLHKIKIKAEIDTLENERKRIAHDIHDELGPMLSAIRLQINLLNTKDDTQSEIKSLASKNIDTILTKTRHISYNLLPNTLVRSGLIAAVNEFISKLNGITSLQIIFEYDEPLNLNSEQSLNIYRIIQEITNNTIKHAQATRLRIELKKQNKGLLLMTADNGIGFNSAQKMSENNGIGLFSIQSRVDVLNAKFYSQSEPGLGTQFTFIIPT
jgi:two-component system NarL family sensor kinase